MKKKIFLTVGILATVGFALTGLIQQSKNHRIPAQIEAYR